MAQVVIGLKAYFELALGSILLYRFERHQYTVIKKSHPHLKMSEIYGAEHLLRLFGMPHAHISTFAKFDCTYEYGPGECGRVEGPFRGLVGVYGGRGRVWGGV